VRTFGLPNLDPRELPRLFPEWRGRGPCRFADCAHREEPGCAMKQALAEGAIEPERYGSYLRLREDLERDAAARLGAARAGTRTGSRTNVKSRARRTPA
jgi:ribosome biogenesis GTPase